MEQKIDLEGIREREQAATLGPWELGVNWQGSQHIVGTPQMELGYFNLDRNGKNNAEFVINARQDIPGLLSEIDRLTSENEEMANQFADVYAEQQFQISILQEKDRRIAELEKENEAALLDLENSSSCDFTCIHGKLHKNDCSDWKATTKSENCFEWRGPQK